jgi:sirohydrochlorin ferrochelatase
MTRESILLIARATGDRETVVRTHADRLAAESDVDAVRVVTYESEPAQELRAALADITADQVYAVPMHAAHTHETLSGIPAALSTVAAEVTYCEPVGQRSAATAVIQARATEAKSDHGDQSLVIVAFGSSANPHQRETAEYHARRLRERTAYAAVRPCYLLQNPTAECVRYNVPTDRAVAVPMFVSATEATESRIPEALELDRGGIDYADPFGTHQGITEAIQRSVREQRAVRGQKQTSPTSFEGDLLNSQQPLATDGEGR